MRVIYKPYMVEKLRKAIRNAANLDLCIDRISITHHEHLQLMEEVGPYIVQARPRNNYFEGVRIEVEGIEL